MGVGLGLGMVSAAASAALVMVGVLNPLLGLTVGFRIGRGGGGAQKFGVGTMYSPVVVADVVTAGVGRVGVVRGRRTTVLSLTSKPRVREIAISLVRGKPIKVRFRARDKTSAPASPHTTPSPQPASAAGQTDGVV